MVAQYLPFYEVSRGAIADRDYLEESEGDFNIRKKTVTLGHSVIFPSPSPCGGQIFETSVKGAVRIGNDKKVIHQKEINAPLLTKT